jgi:peptidoglycan/LPS O-acetylase OafA/YrhL
VSQRFFVLDGLRGVAAIVVVCFHLSFFKWIPTPTFGYLAVDLFFALSGFVIARAYDPRFASGRLTFRGFMVRRLVRLFPLYVAGFTIGLTIAVRTEMLFPTVSWAHFWLTALTNLFLLPTPFLSNDIAGLFPSDPPAWSLFLELWIANLVYGATWRLLNIRMLAAVVLISAMALIFCSISFGSLNLGVRWSESFVGFSRVSFSFFAGVLLSRLPLKVATNHISPIAIFAVLAVVLCVPLEGYLARAFELLCIFLIFPCVIAVGSQSSSKAHPKLSSWLGDVSYALYLIHYPLILKIDNIMRVHDASPGLGSALVFIVLVVVLSTLLDLFYDRPLRILSSKCLSASA